MNTEDELNKFPFNVQYIIRQHVTARYFMLRFTLILYVIAFIRLNKIF